ncbi:MAG: hypothetical protein RR603_01930, partial [Kurthia sp.]
MHEYDDFYHEPSEFEMQIEEFKQSLIASVKEEYVDKMDSLIKENNQLQEAKRNLKSIEQDYEKRKCELAMEKEEIHRQVRRERLSELTKDLQVS